MSDHPPDSSSASHDPATPPLLDYRPLDRRPRPTARRVLSYTACFASIFGGAALIGTLNDYVSLVLTGFAFIVAGCFGLYAIQPPPLHVPPVRYRLFAVASAASAIASSFPLVISLLLPVPRYGRRPSWPTGKLAWFVLSLVAYGVARRLIARWIQSHAPKDWTPRALRRRQIQVWSLAAVTFLAICSVPTIVVCYNWVSLRLDFHNAMSHALAPDQVVHTDDPPEASRLVRSDPTHYFSRYPILPTRTIANAYYTSPLLDQSPQRRDPLLFLHARQSPGQPPVLVVLTLLTGSPSVPTPSTTVLATAYRPPTWRQSDWPAPCSAARILLPLVPPGRLRILAGQPDPNDPARFTLPVQINDHPHTLVGTLDPTSQLRLTWADTSPPTTAPTPPSRTP